MPQPYQLKNLFDQGQYEQVAAFWSNPGEVAQFSQWDFRDCMNSLYKLKRYEDCLEVYRACSRRYPDFTYLDDKMGWSLYHTKIRDFDFRQGDKQALRRQVDYVFAHSSNSRYSPRWVLAKYMVDAIGDGSLGQERNWQLAAHYLDQVDPAVLDTQERLYTDEEGRSRMLASNQESWYSEKSKLLLRLEDYDGCMACCDQALQVITKFHSHNDSWFRYRKAQCLKALGRSEEAGEYVRQILQSGFSHWCLLQLMFEFEVAAGNRDRALAYAGACATSDPEHKMRVSFYEELANDLEGHGEEELPMLLRRLVLLLRAENEWSMKNDQAQWQFTDEIAAMDKQAVLKRLLPVWQEWRDKDKVFLTGTVDRLLAEGRSGFIAADNGQSYYFNARDIRGRQHEPYAGMKVRFTLVDKLDKSKGVVKPNAVEITVL